MRLRPPSWRNGHSRLTNCIDLDFLETVKLVNYVRREVRNGNTSPNVSQKSAFEDDQYLQPVLEDDALLYSLDDVIGDTEASKDSLTNGNKIDNHHCSATQRAFELEKELKSALEEFADYKAMASRALDKQWKTDTAPTTSSNADSMINIGAPAPRDDDSHYFNSYSYNGKLMQGLKVIYAKRMKTSMRRC